MISQYNDLKINSIDSIILQSSFSFSFFNLTCAGTSVAINTLYKSLLFECLTVNILFESWWRTAKVVFRNDLAIGIMPRDFPEIVRCRE